MLFCSVTLPCCSIRLNIILVLWNMNLVTSLTNSETWWAQKAPRSRDGMLPAPLDLGQYWLISVACKLYTNGISHVCLFGLTWCLWDSFMLLCVVVCVHSHGSIPLYEYTTIYLSNPLLADIGEFLELGYYEKCCCKHSCPCLFINICIPCCWASSRSESTFVHA